MSEDKVFENLLDQLDEVIGDHEAMIALEAVFTVGAGIICDVANNKKDAMIVLDDCIRNMRELIDQYLEAHNMN
jgi:hypothetical protein